MIVYLVLNHTNTYHTQSIIYYLYLDSDSIKLFQVVDVDYSSEYYW